jgi:hypothetical protein
MFFDEFVDFMASQMLSSGTLILLGDFNFHVDNPDNPDASRFLSILDSVGLQQHVAESTHNKDHILDLVITRTGENIIGTLQVRNPMISDHYPVHLTLNVEKPEPQKKVLVYRKLKSIDRPQLATDIKDSALYTTPANEISELVEQYDTVLQELLDKHAPTKTRVVTIRPVAPWYTDEIREAKKARRKAETTWRSTKLTVHRDIYKHHRDKVTMLLEKGKHLHFSKKIDDNSGDQKALFKVINQLLHRKNESPLPSHTSTEELSNLFSQFFGNKIVKLRSGLTSIQDQFQAQAFSNHIPSCQLSSFKPASQEEIRKLVMSAASKSCSLDPVPTWLLEDNLDELLPVLTKIVNLSLETATMPINMKAAIVTHS